MNIVPEYLAEVFCLPSSEPSKKSYKPWVITEGRTITDKEHQAWYKEKEEIKSKKEKEKEDRINAREKKMWNKVNWRGKQKIKTASKKERQRIH